MKNKMKLNIQLFAEETDVDDMAANEDVDLEAEDNTNNDDADVVNETPIDKTKAFSERLKTKTAEIEKSYQDKLDNIAKQQGFETWEELEEASERQAMEDLGVEDADKFQKLVNNAINKNPDVIKAREIVKRNEEAARQKEVDAQIKLIGTIDSSITSMDDLAKEENIQEIIDKVKKGYNLYDAYRIVNMDKIISNGLSIAKQNAINDVNSKSHLITSTGVSGKTVHVPNDVYMTYKRNMPNWTDEQIKKHYAKTMEGK